MVVPDGLAQAARVPSPSCGITDLADAYEVPEAARRELACGAGWEGRWEASWRRDGAVAISRVSDLGQVLGGGCQPWRHFTWRTGQRHRPGLQFLVSTGRHHGFESLEEQRFLLALDFAGGVTDVVSQPFRLRAETTAGWREHIPDFLAVTGDGAWLVDVRPRDLVKDEDLVLFAAAAEAALAAGWRYAVICGWRPHAMATLDMLSSQRRPMADPLRLAPQLLAAARAGPLGFDDLTGATSCPAVARAHALHLIWHRRLGIDLAGPLTGQLMVWLGAGSPGEGRAGEAGVRGAADAGRRGVEGGGMPSADRAGDAARHRRPAPPGHDPGAGQRSGIPRRSPHLPVRGSGRGRCWRT